MFRPMHKNCSFDILKKCLPEIGRFGFEVRTKWYSIWVTFLLVCIPKSIEKIRWVQYPLSLKFSVKSIDPASSFETFTSALSWKIEINQNYNDCCHSAGVLMWCCGILASKVTRSNYIFGNEISCTEERRDCTEKMHIFIECMECFIITRCIRMQMKSTKAFVE